MSQRKGWEIRDRRRKGTVRKLTADFNRRLAKAEALRERLREAEPGKRVRGET